jgi:hypothetical protein
MRAQTVTELVMGRPGQRRLMRGAARFLLLSPDMVSMRPRVKTNGRAHRCAGLSVIAATACWVLAAAPALAAGAEAQIQPPVAARAASSSAVTPAGITPPPATEYGVGRVQYSGIQSSDGSDRAAPHAVRHSWTEPFALDLSAATWVPLSVGPELAFELPGRVLAQVHLGWMPELYSHTLTNVLEDAGVYDRQVGDLVDGAVQGATTWRVAAGWRPFESAGLELAVGYAHVALDGATRTSELIPFVPPDVADELNAEVGDIGINLDSSIHHFTIAAGWRWLIADHLVIRANVGYLQAFASHSTLDIEGRPDLTSLAAPTVESVLHDHYMRYIKIPVVGLGVGYRFF